MARSRRTKQVGSILEKVGRALSGGSSKRSGGRRANARQRPRRRKSGGAKGLLRRLLG